MNTSQLARRDKLNPNGLTRALGGEIPARNHPPPLPPTVPSIHGVVPSYRPRQALIMIWCRCVVYGISRKTISTLSWVLVNREGWTGRKTLGIPSSWLSAGRGSYTTGGETTRTTLPKNHSSVVLTRSSVLFLRIVLKTYWYMTMTSENVVSLFLGACAVSIQKIKVIKADSSVVVWDYFFVFRRAVHRVPQSCKGCGTLMLS